MTRFCLLALALALVNGLFVCPLKSAAAQKNCSRPLPQTVTSCKTFTGHAPEAILEKFLGLPYRIDGSTNEFGQYTYFSRPELIETEPGLNCSGFVLTASRLLLRNPMSLEAAKRDRLLDSGPNSPHGHDWDFGWDLILNIAEPFPHKMFLPGNKHADIAKANGQNPLGYELNSPAIWQELLDRFKPGHLYLLSWNEQNRRSGYRWMHYHTGLIHKNLSGNVWLYQTSRQGKAVNRRDMATSQGRESFLQDFVSKTGKKRYLTIIEISLPPPTDSSF